MYENAPKGALGGEQIFRSRFATEAVAGAVAVPRSRTGGGDDDSSGRMRVGKYRQGYSKKNLRRRGKRTKDNGSQLQYLGRARPIERAVPTAGADRQTLGRRKQSSEQSAVMMMMMMRSC